MARRPPLLDPSAAFSPPSGVLIGLAQGDARLEFGGLLRKVWAFCVQHGVHVLLLSHAFTIVGCLLILSGVLPDAGCFAVRDDWYSSEQLVLIAANQSGCAHETVIAHAGRQLRTRSGSGGIDEEYLSSLPIAFEGLWASLWLCNALGLSLLLFFLAFAVSRPYEQLHTLLHSILAILVRDIGTHAAAPTQPLELPPPPLCPSPRLCFSPPRGASRCFSPPLASPAPLTSMLLEPPVRRPATFITAFVFVLVGFYLALFALYPRSGDHVLPHASVFNSWYTSLLDLLNLALLAEKVPINVLPESFDVLSRWQRVNLAVWLAIYYLFLVVSCILMLNLLIAMLSHTFEEARAP